MKLILSFTSLALVFFISTLGRQDSVDYTGTYQYYDQNPQVQKEVIQLRANFTFEYRFVRLDTSKPEIVIGGAYKIQGKKLKLFPRDFGEEGQEYERARARFAVGNSRLQATYHLRQWRNQLSLCSQEVKRELLLPEFVKVGE